MREKMFESLLIITNHLAERLVKSCGLFEFERKTCSSVQGKKNSVHSDLQMHRVFKDHSAVNTSHSELS